MNWLVDWVPVLLWEGVDELGEDVSGDDGLGEVLVVVGEAAESLGRIVLHRRDRVQQQGPQQCHDACLLQHFYVLWVGCQVCHALHKGYPCLLVGLEDLQHWPWCWRGHGGGWCGEGGGWWVMIPWRVSERERVTVICLIAGAFCRLSRCAILFPEKDWLFWEGFL